MKKDLSKFRKYLKLDNSKNYARLPDMFVTKEGKIIDVKGFHKTFIKKYQP